MIDDISGRRFGRWLVLERAQTLSMRSRWKCQCECGVIREVRHDGLISGESKSCGCLQKDIAREIRVKGNKSKALPEGEASFNSVYRAYRQGAAKRSLEFRLTKEEFKTISSQPCFYCGAEPSQVYHSEFYNGEFVFSGIDRMNNKEGYTTDNCVPCCWTCNRAKLNRDRDEFIAWIRQVYSHLQA